MGKKFVFTAKYLSNLLIKMIIPCVIISLILFLTLEIKFSYKYLISMMIVFAGILSVFYQNRYDVQEFNVNEGELEFSYFNKTFFKKEKVKKSNVNIKIDVKNDEVTFSDINEVIGIIRKCSTDEEKWNELVEFAKS